MTTSKQQNECGVHNPGGTPCTKPKGHEAGHDDRSYGPQQNEEQLTPERIWLKLQEINGHRRYMESSDFDNGDIEYIRADLAAAGAVSIPDAQLRAAAEEIAIKYLRPSVLGSDSWDNAVDQVIAILERRLSVGPPIPDAVLVVERWRNETERPTDQLVAADMILDRLRSLSPSVGVGTEDAALTQLQKVYDYFMGPHACGDFTCTCNEPKYCGICEIRAETEAVLPRAATDTKEG